MVKCLAYKKAGSGSNQNGECKVCEKGFFLDKDGYCVEVTAPQCQSF